MPHKPGPAEIARREMRERWYEQGQAKNKAAQKTTVADLREKVADVKLKPRKAKKKKGKK